MTNKEKLLRREQFAEYFDVNVRTVDRWIEIGEIKPDEVVRIGGGVRIKESAIDRILKGGEFSKGSLAA